MIKDTVVVTGAAGRVGIRIVQAFLEAGYAVHTLVRSKLSAGHPLTCENVTITVMDLATLPEQDASSWLKAVRPIALIHSAALSDVSGCERQPSLAYLVNAHVTRMFARICALHQIHFIMLSTEQVFSGTSHPDILYYESDSVHPLNCYGKSKVQGEIATQEECAKATLWTICRISAIYGLTYDRALWRPDFMQWVRTKLEQKEELRIVIDQVNSPIFIVDLIRILVAVVRRQLQGIYHVAGSSPISRYHCALQIAKMCSLNEALIQPAFTTDLALGSQRPLNAGLCVEKISRESGIHPLSIEEGLASCLSLRS
jgi:dTDP-4-dehydrorhamnose reductase